MFYLDDNKSMPVKAAGIILTRTARGAKGSTEFLMQIRKYANDAHRPKWLPLLAISPDGFYDVVEDFGGKVEDTDTSIHDIMVREALEESNGTIDADSLRERLRLPSTRFVYCERSKYVVALVPATEQEVALTGDEFGDREVHDEWLIQRTVRWMRTDELRRNYRRNLHCRLRPLTDFKNRMVQ
jgi:hypothetical protein